MKESLAALERHNVVQAVTSESIEDVEHWKRNSPERIIPALLTGRTGPEEEARIRRLAEEGRIKVLGELPWQYGGLSASAPELDGIWALAEELDLPLGIHLGPTPAGWSQTVAPKLRIRNGSPFLLEDAVVKHPKARVYIMHAGWPFEDDMVAMLYQYPDLHVDVAWINWSLPRGEFHRYLKRLTEAGFAKRIMYGSDQMLWPETIGLGIEAIESAQFLTEEQKGDILCGNAARFLRLNPGLCR
jgi:predicted TIM-barrel fold metal-dependent hydrolase